VLFTSQLFHLIDRTVFIRLKKVIIFQFSDRERLPPRKINLFLAARRVKSLAILAVSPGFPKQQSGENQRLVGRRFFMVNQGG
jgi:hypothetical protein